MLKIGFIGAGTVGTALAIRLSQQGYRVITVHDLKLAAAQRLAQAVKDCRILEKAQGVADTAEFVFITTVDDFIPQVAAKVSWHTGQTVVHCSGAASTEALAPAKEQGARVGCIHPLQTFASITQAVENLPGSTFAIEAEEPTLSVLKELATSLQGSWLELKAEDKA
ncbi:MAG: NAD(P)-binding domain-containing protein, partial [Dehalococcoidales bacterium]|nr:NAD(P)-binding domain-containing protein [Dehalococcoidales bacterium]